MWRIFAAEMSGVKALEESIKRLQDTPLTNQQALLGHRHRSPRSQLDPNWLISPRVPRAHLPGLSVSHQMSRGCKLQQISRGCSTSFYPDTEHWTGRRAVTFIKSWLNWSFFDLSSPCLLVWNCQKSCRVSESIMLSNCYLGRYQGGTNPISLE